MTNFEKWKQSLTVETAAELLSQDEGCLNCPIHGSDKCRSMMKCRDNFAEWANAEAEEGAEK